VLKEEGEGAFGKGLSFGFEGKGGRGGGIESDEDAADDCEGAEAEAEEFLVEGFGEGKSLFGSLEQRDPLLQIMAEPLKLVLGGVACI
jgi:hypothetical protein